MLWLCQLSLWSGLVDFGEVGSTNHHLEGRLEKAADGATAPTAEDIGANIYCMSNVGYLRAIWC